MAVTSPGVGDPVAFIQGFPTPFPGGDRTTGAIVLSANALVVTLAVFTPENNTAVVAGVSHASIAPAGSAAWSWSAASGHSNS